MNATIDKTMEQIKANNNAFEDIQYSKKIACPENPEHEATLYQYPHRFAGIWECDTCEISDAHECEEFYDDTATTDHLGFQGHYQTETPVQVCVDCEVVLEV